jgi:hypothetical protein
MSIPTKHSAPSTVIPSFVGLIGGVLFSGLVQAQAFPEANITTGEQFHTEMCVACHAKQFGGEDGTEIYTRPDRRVQTPSGLLSQLSTCTSLLNLELFPEDELHIAGYLDRHFYRFKAQAKPSASSDPEPQKPPATPHVPPK